MHRITKHNDVLKFCIMRTTKKNTNEKTVRKSNLYLTLLFLGLLSFSLCLAECNTNALANDTEYAFYTIELIQTSLKGCGNKVVWLDGIELQSAPLICNFYENNNYTPVWTFGNELTEQAEDILDLLKDAYKYGFEPSYFDVPSLEQFTVKLTKETNIKKSAKLRARFEFLMTNSIFTFMLHLTQGTEYATTNNVFINEDIFVSKFPEYLNKIHTSKNIKEEILILQPDDEEYIALQCEMEMIVMDIVTSEDVIVVPDDTNNPTHYINLFSYVFEKSGIASEETAFSDSKIFTSLLIEFQKIAGIRTTGKIDKATQRAVAGFVRSRYQEIAFNLEKIRKNTKFDQTFIASKS